MARSHGTGEFALEQFAALGSGVVFERGVLVFHPENIEIGSDVYVGHNAILKGYYKSRIVIGDGTWIGQMAFLHGAGGLSIGRNVGVGPCVMVVTSTHRLDQLDRPILHSEICVAPVVIEDDCDVGVGAVILPGVRIGKGAQVGAGAVVRSHVEAYSIVAGVPATLIRRRS